MWERVITINGNLSYKPTHTHTQKDLLIVVCMNFLCFPDFFNDSEQNEAIMI